MNSYIIHHTFEQSETLVVLLRLFFLGGGEVFLKVTPKTEGSRVYALAVG
jgi:hypothetical protein